MLYNEIHFFISLLLGLFFVLSMLLLYLIIQKAIANNRRCKIDVYKELTREQMYRYISSNEDSQNFVPTSQVKFKALEELLAGYTKLLEGETATERIRTFATTYFKDSYKRSLFHRRWSIRMNTLYMIDDFHMENLFPEVLRLYESKRLTSSEETQILKIMAGYGYEGLEEHIRNPKYPLSEFMVRSIYNRMPLEKFNDLLERYDDLDVELQLPLIDLIAVKNLYSYKQHLIALLSSEKFEVRIRSLKAIAELGLFIPTDTLVKHLFATQWQERMMAAKVCGGGNDLSCIDILKELMSDSHFLVRSQAAQSIGRLPKGKDILRQLSENSPDSYTKDIATEWLERG
ncbi:HEAT repeat domain-containing protein [Litchfieldia salsa]|uniref:HEAT repeat domain-containing protein n=1 Tax=Litchfieldia salsa TaxID=930152 RepID=A0A1H0RLJ2_9BACI|nr:HEAT repeat domain-containing protein [Litchfieldia salsa]SDP30352.1 hypothetical protein SAMN05216565_102278 [Litchfieldia salsa]